MDHRTVTPLGAPRVRITGGLLADWQRRNREATVPHTLEQLRKAGNLDNLRRLLSEGKRQDAPYRGRYPFLDTDLYKTVEGLAYELARPDGGGRQAMRDFYEETVGLLERVQAPDGYLNSFFQDPDCAKAPWEDLAWGHEMYNLGHLIQAAVAAHRQLGDRRLLDVAIRFADLVVERYGPRGEEAVCGHPEVEMALVELSRETGEERYLTQARLFVDRRGRGTVASRGMGSAYFQDHLPLRELPSVTGHAVRMTYLAAGATDVSRETGDTALLEALRRLWDDMVATKLYVTGGLGSRHSDEAVGDRYELPSERSYSETCAAIGTMQWAWRMFLATGDARYPDILERVLYNAFAVGLSADGRAFFYDNPLQRRPDHDQRSGAEEGGEPLRRAWFGCPCCPPNVVRWMARLADFLAAERPGELLVAGYAQAGVDGEEAALDMTTGYPWDGEVRLTVRRAPDGPYRISLRVPGWADAGQVRLTVGEEAAAGDAVDGWLTVERRWRPGDVLRLSLPMPVRGHVSHPYLDATRGAVAVARGPLVYCVEQQDCTAGVDDVVIGAEHIEAARTVAPAGAVLIRITADVAPPPSPELYPLLATGARQAPPGPGSDTAELTLVPYFAWGNREPGPMRVWIRNA
ncbi:glycoside hydrolase family 127 protein [Streptomyces sp. ME19-01-6]|uniref:glycoside hydrolase family 127 protein n=1 Tax=Streptomyces sp. ME19-01-6 TaxID=3028686 RepID=UPI0029BCFC1B|nr:beta-L-arabinofuranosidase domain-containing protein [Streptomyces sp. ME19-01-6]MDX3233004.1 glycoside hydrolase family 127 protein [Streptomyces sp. ME19-01-6]